MSNLHGCQEYTPHQWLCGEITTTKRIEHAICEVALFFKTTTAIPADTEICDRLSNNEWLFIISKPTTLSILCNQRPTQEKTIQRIGTLRLQRNCKAYTEDAILEADSTVEMANITNKISNHQHHWRWLLSRIKRKHNYKSNQIETTVTNKPRSKQIKIRKTQTQ